MANFLNEMWYLIPLEYRVHMHLYYKLILTFFPQQTVEKSLFLNYFYKHCMHRLMAPLMAQTAGPSVSRGMCACVCACVCACAFGSGCT